MPEHRYRRIFQNPSKPTFARITVQRLGAGASALRSCTEPRPSLRRRQKSCCRCTTPLFSYTASSLRLSYPLSESTGRMESRAACMGSARAPRAVPHAPRVPCRTRPACRAVHPARHTGRPQCLRRALGRRVYSSGRRIRHAGRVRSPCTPPGFPCVPLILKEGMRSCGFKIEVRMTSDIVNPPDKQARIPQTDQTDSTNEL